MHTTLSGNTDDEDVMSCCFSHKDTKRGLLGLGLIAGREKIKGDSKQRDNDRVGATALVAETLTALPTKNANNVNGRTFLDDR